MNGRARHPDNDQLYLGPHIAFTNFELKWKVLRSIESLRLPAVDACLFSVSIAFSGFAFLFQFFFFFLHSWILFVHVRLSSESFAFVSAKSAYNCIHSNGRIKAIRKTKRQRKNYFDFMLSLSLFRLFTVTQCAWVCVFGIAAEMQVFFISRFQGVCLQPKPFLSGFLFIYFFLCRCSCCCCCCLSGSFFAFH